MNNELFNREDKWAYFLLATLALPGAPESIHSQIAEWKYTRSLTAWTRILPTKIANLVAIITTPPSSIQITIPAGQAFTQDTQMTYYQTELTPFANISTDTILERLISWYKSLNYEIYDEQKMIVSHSKKMISLDKNTTQSIPILIHHISHILLKHPLDNPCTQTNEYIVSCIEYYYRTVLNHPEAHLPIAPGYNYEPTEIQNIITQIRNGIYKIGQIISAMIEPEFTYNKLDTPPHIYIEQTIGCSSWGYPPQIIIGYLPGDCSYELSKYLKNYQIPYKAISLEADPTLRQRAKTAGYTNPPVIFHLDGTPLAGLTKKPQGTHPTIAKTLFTLAHQKIKQLKQTN